MMDAIGGYFPLELRQYKEYHKEAIRLNTGRNCLEYILRVRNYDKVYIPYYTCEVLIEPFKNTSTQYEFYHINNHLEIADVIKLNDGEALLYTNYFGLKQEYVRYLATIYGKQLIVDNTQAFFAAHIKDIDTFYTCRKFFGVPDGAYLYCNKELNEEIEQDHSYNRMSHLLKRIDLSVEEGYSDFKQIEDGLVNQHILTMSRLTRRLMKSIDYMAAAQRRRANYAILHEALGNENSLDFPLGDSIPLAYPYFVPVKGLRRRLIYNKVYVACYWPNVIEWSNPDDIENVLACQLLPLPIDQRYGEAEMKRIIGIIKNGII